MTKFIARFLLQVATAAIMLGNYWYTFGLWPKSWLSFFLFFGATTLVVICSLLVELEGR